jgi:hypothetical protein
VTDRGRPLAALLDDIRAAVTRYVVVGTHEAVAVTLWVAHCWVLDAFDATGYLEIRSPVRRCGKSTLLDVIVLLVPRPWKTIEPSEAVFYRKIDQSTPTLLLDEVDAIFGKKDQATEGLRACLNAGNVRGTTVPRCLPPRMDVVEFNVFCAKALAGIGGLPATITDRSIPITMRRKQKSDPVERFRRRRVQDEMIGLVAELEWWATNAVDEVEAQLAQVEQLADDGGPLESLDDRAFEQAWEPLLAVASVAGPDWLQAAIAAAVDLSGGRDDELDLGVTLLRDIRTVFERDPGRDSLATAELLDELFTFEESPWRDWWSDPRSDELKPSKAAPRKLARLLGPFGIQPSDVWTPSGASRKGYRLDDFHDAWARYLLATDPREGRGAREPAADAGFTLADAEHGSARNGTDPRGAREDLAQTNGSRAPRGHRGSEEKTVAFAPTATITSAARPRAAASSSTGKRPAHLPVGAGRRRSRVRPTSSSSSSRSPPVSVSTRIRRRESPRSSLRSRLRPAHPGAAAGRRPARVAAAEPGGARRSEDRARLAPHP